MSAIRRARSSPAVWAGSSAGAYLALDPITVADAAQLKAFVARVRQVMARF
jgi:hypothetical protein